MAGTGDSTNNTPEKHISDNLVASNDSTHLDAYRQSSPPGNADRPGTAEVKQPQAGGPAAPPESAAAAAPKSNEVATVAKPGQDATHDGADKGKAAEVGPTPKALEVMKQVNSILDGDVPKLNKAHDLNGAQQAYEKAITIAKTLTPEDIAKAQKDLDEVRKEKAAEKDPAKLRELANKEVDLYTITRLKDAALGNEALWFYRQGKTEQGNEKLLEASGVDPAKAHDMRKLGDADIKQFGEVLNHGVSPILGDVNFYRQLNKVKESNGQIPPIFAQIHQAVLDHNKEAGKAGDQTAGTPAAATAGDAFDPKQAKAAIDAFDALSAKLDKTPAALTADQRAVMDAGVKAYDGKNTAIGNLMDASQKSLDALIPRDKQEAFGKASDTVNKEIDKIAAANGNKIPPETQKNIVALVNNTSPAEFTAASAALSKTNPDLVTALKTATDLLPKDKKGGMAAMQAYSDNSDLQKAFVHSSLEQTFAHCTYAKLLLGSKTPPDAADFTRAQQVMRDGFKNIPSQVADKVQADKDVQKLIVDLKLNDQPAAAPGAAPGADKTAGAASAPGADSKAGATTDNTKGAAPGAATGLDQLSPTDLQKQLKAAQDKGAPGMKDAKALFEEEIKRASNPEMKAHANDVLKANLTALETGKAPDGTAIDANTRIALHQNNVEMVGALSAEANIRSDYALYLGDKRLNLDPANAHAQLEGGLNQIKSMDEQQKLAIKAADGVDVGLLQRVDKAIKTDRAAGIGDDAGAKALNDFKTIMEGGKDSSGEEQPGMLGLRVGLRDQLAALYLTQGAQFKPDGSALGAMMPKDHHTDELFKPQVALQLLTEAKAANEQVYGKGAQDQTTAQLYAMGQTLQPEIFKGNADHLKASGANITSDMAAMATSVAGSMVVRFAAAALTEGKLNPMTLNAIGDVAAVSTGIATRHLVHGMITGKSESWGDSAIHGGAAALMPIGFKYSSEFLASNKMAQSVLNWRSAKFTTDAVLERAGGAIGKDATFAQTAEVFRNSGMKTEADALAKFGTKPLSEATPEEMAGINNALNLNGARGREALLKIFPAMDKAGQEAKIVGALEKRGIHTTADLDARLKQTADRVAGLNQEVQGAQIAGVKDSTPVSDALRRMVGADSRPVYATQEAVDNEAKFLAEHDIKTVGQLKSAGANAHQWFTVSKMFPELANTPAATIREAAAHGNVLGEATSAGRVQLKGIVPEAHAVSGRSTGILHSIANKGESIGSYAKDVAWDNRFYRVSMDGSPVRFAGSRAQVGLLSAETDATQSGWRATAAKLKPELGGKISMPNLQAVDPRFATAEQLKLLSAQTKLGTATLASIPAIGLYNTATFENDNWYKGTQYQDQKGEWHKYSFTDALVDANLGARNENIAARVATGTLGQALLGGFFLKGAMAPVLEEAPAAAQSSAGWLGRKIPALAELPGKIGALPRVAAGRDAVVGGRAALTAVGSYAAFGNPNSYQGVLDIMDGSDKQHTYESTQAPLRDYAPDDVGTAADQVNAAAAANPPAEAAPPPQPAASDTTGGAAAPPPEQAPTPAAAAAAAPEATRPAAPPAAAPASAPAAPKPAANGDLGSAMAPPGS